MANDQNETDRSNRENSLVSSQCGAVRLDLHNIFVTDALSEERQHEIQVHLRQCSDCRAHFQTYQSIDGMMRDSVADPSYELVKDLVTTPDTDPLDAALAEAGVVETTMSTEIPPRLKEWLASMNREEHEEGKEREEWEGHAQGEAVLASSGDSAADALWSRTAKMQHESHLPMIEYMAAELARACRSYDLPATFGNTESTTWLQAKLQKALTSLLANERTHDELLALLEFSVHDKHQATHEAVLDNNIALPLYEVASAQNASNTDRYALREIRSPMGREIFRQSGLSQPIVQVLDDDRNERKAATTEEIPGAERSAQAAVQLLERAVTLEVQPRASIIITWLLDTEVLDVTDTLRVEWNAALRRLLERGWHVQHLIRSTEDTPKAFRVVEHMRTLLGAKGLYEPFLLSPQCTWHPLPKPTEGPLAAYEYVVVPGLGCLTMVAPDGQHVTRARLTRPGSEFDQLRARVEIERTKATPVYRARYIRPSVAYQEGLVRIEQKPADRYCVTNGLGESTVPSAVHQERAAALRAQGRAGEQVIAQTLRAQIDREQLLMKHLHQHSYIDVCPRGAVERLVEKGMYQTQDSWMALGAPPLTPAQTRRHLEYLIQRLETQSNYHLALLTAEGANLAQTEFLVKPRHAAMVEFWLTDSEGQPQHADLEIVEPSIVDALCDPELWEDIKNHAETDKGQVIRFLHEQLQRL